MALADSARAPAQPPRPRARPLGRRRAGTSARPRAPGAILDSVTGPRLGVRCCRPLLAEGVSGGDEEVPGRRTQTARDREGKLSTPRQPEPQRWSRVGARRGTSVSNAGGARGAATAGARTRGPGRSHVRAAGAAAARAARAAPGGVWGKPPPAAGKVEARGRSPESGGEVCGGPGRARGATGTPRPGLGTCQQGVVARARRPRVAGLGDGLLRARLGRRGCKQLEIPGAEAGRRTLSEKSGTREALSGKLGELRCSRSGRAAHLHPEAARPGLLQAAR